jgi:anti-sigma factor RsiW
MLQDAEQLRRRPRAAAAFCLLRRLTLAIALAGCANALAVVTAAALSSTTSLTANPNPSNLGADVTFTATVSGSGPTPTGTVTFTVGADTFPRTLNNGVASFNTPGLSAGGHQINAEYLGDASYTGSSAQVIQVVNKGSSSTSLSAVPSPSNVGQSVTFTATVSGSGATPTGFVDFVVDGNVAAHVQVNASAVASFTTSPDHARREAFLHAC